MSWQRIGSHEEYRFEVTGEATMAAVRNPDARHFLPTQVQITYDDGDLTSIMVYGPYLNKQGKPLTRVDGFTGFDADDLAEGTSGEMPDWLIRLVLSHQASRSHS